MPMFKKILKIIFVLLTGIIAIPAKAVCPVCAVAAGAGLGLTRWLGIDDTITGVWLGGLLISVTIWTVNWFDKKQINFKGKKIITGLFYYLITILPLYFTGVIGHPFNRIWGVDKLIVGTILSTIFFGLAVVWYLKLKKRNNNKAYFPFQKVVMPISALLFLSIFFYFLTE